MTKIERIKWKLEAILDELDEELSILDDPIIEEAHTFLHECIETLDTYLDDN